MTEELNPGNPNYLPTLASNIQTQYVNQNKPLVLLPEWSKGSESVFPDSGFTEGAADAIFASLVQLDQALGGAVGEHDAQGNLIRLYDDEGDLLRTQGALFNSPLHFIGFSRGAVVNSEMIQRLGTFFPNAGGLLNADGTPVLDGQGQPIRDLQMTTIDPHDFAQESLKIDAAIPGSTIFADFRDFHEPTVQVWENVTFADNYYQTVADPYGATWTPNGRFLEGADVNLRLDGRTGFTEDDLRGRPHNHAWTWYAGTLDLSSSEVQSVYEQPSNALAVDEVYDQLGEKSLQELLALSTNLVSLTPWYSSGGVQGSTEGIGTGWFYSVLGGGQRPATDLTKRVPVDFENTDQDIVEGDFAVPTVFNGNFDIGLSDAPDAPVPGWSFHNGGQPLLRKYLVDVSTIATLVENVTNSQVSLAATTGTEPQLENQKNFAVKLGDGNPTGYIRNPEIVPDWGVLRFNLHIPNLSGGNLTVTLRGENGVTKTETISFTAADGPYDLGYNELDTYRIGYGTQSFETFHIDVPDSLRGQIATLEFQVNGGTAYLDDVFFKSEHLWLGNPKVNNVEARPSLTNGFSTNYLIERPQYALSYNNNLKGPNWVAYKYDRSWLGNLDRPEANIPWTTLPPGFEGSDRLDYPWRSDDKLRYTFADITIGSDYRRSDDYDRGHMVTRSHRNRTQKDQLATYFTSSILPQHRDNNRDSFPPNSAWVNFENHAREELVRVQGKELYIISGGYKFDSNITNNGIVNGKQIKIPEYTWKIVVVTNPGQNLEDIDLGTSTIAIMTPNRPRPRAEDFPITDEFLPGHVMTINSLADWRNWETWRVDYNYIQELPGLAKFRFFSNVPSSSNASLLAQLSPTDELFKSDGSFYEDAFRINSVTNESTFQSTQYSSSSVGIFQIDPHHFTTTQISSTQIGSAQIGSTQTTPTSRTDSTQISPTQITPSQIGTTQIGATQVDVSQINPTQFSSTQINSTKVSLPSSISSSQFFTIHNTTPESLYTINNSTHTLSNSPGLLNGDFEITNPNDPSYGWNRRGAAIIGNSKAILTEESPFLSNLSQTFIIPESAKTLQFTLTATQLGHSHLAPPDAFEVALLDANTLTPLVGTSTGLSQTDSFFNLQANGTAYFSNFVKSNSTTPSGRTISVDISHLSPGTLATLYFDLLGFGERDSRIEIDRIRLLSNNQLAPIANNDTATTSQGQPITLNVLANDSDADGTINPTTLQLVTTPTHGTVSRNPDHTFTYTPNNGFVGTDSFTYTIQDNDGLTSLPAVVTLNVTNLPPQIDDIDIESSITEGTKTTLSAIATDPGNDILTYTWNLSDGTNLTGQQIEHTFADNGIYTATITVTDVHGASSTKIFNLVVNNSAPLVDAGEDLTINEGQLITFNGNFSDLGLNDTHTFSWNFGDGSTVSGILTPSHTYTQNGTYTATLTVSDQDSATNSDSLTVTVNNLAPTITAITGETQINQGETATFSATAFDPGNDSLAYTWDFGNGSEPHIGQNITYTFTQVGTYELSLTVTDDEGAFTTQTRNITVNNVAPVITKIENTIANEGFPTYFSATASDPGNDPITYTWDFGDGSEPFIGQNVTHTFINSGDSNVTLTVTDSHGASTVQTIDLTINNIAPTITQVQSDTNIDEGDTAHFNATATDPGNDPLTYTWDFGDGSEPLIGQNVSHQFINNGIYIITLTAIDSEGAATTQTQNITVNNLAPTVEAGEDQMLYSDETIAFNGTFSDPGLNDTHTLTWDFGDGTIITNTLNPTHHYATFGTYNVTFTVIDNLGAISNDTLTVTVKKLPTLSVSDVTITEGDTGNTTALFTVSLSEASPRPITVNYTTVDGTATTGGDYLANSSTLTFAPGQTSQTISVSIIGDVINEADENLTLQLSQITNATLVKSQGAATIIDNDASPSLSINDLTLTEGNSGTTIATFTVSLSAASGQTVTVNYSTANGTAEAGNDYTANNGILTFNPGQITQTISVPVNGDLSHEASETFSVNLINATNATIADAIGMGTIIDNDLQILPFAIKAEGTVTINGSGDFDGDPLNLNDDARIYAGRGFTINGNPTLPVRRDANGNPIRDANNKLVLIDRAVTVAPGYNVLNANTNLYANLVPPQVIEAQTVLVPAYTDIISQETARRVPTGTPIVTFNVQNNPLNSAADWKTRFPSSGTATQPTVVRVINGGLNIPANVTLSNLVITIEGGDLNFNGNGHTLNNVMFVTNNGNINLSGVQAQNVSLFASGSIQMNANARFSGSSLLANSNSNGSINFNGSTTTDVNSSLRVVAMGEINFNGSSKSRGTFVTARNFSYNGNSTLWGSIEAKGNIIFNGQATIVATS